MKNALMVVGTESSFNIGDYIQALAAKQFLPQVDILIEREQLSDYDGEEVKMIMNGWYTHHPEHWPPSIKIHPLFIAVHINESVKNRFSKKDSIAYLKKYQPIGCRDIQTRDFLLSNGVESYFSGCLTLTLNLQYFQKKRDNKTYFVDPFVPSINRYNLYNIYLLYRFIFNYKTILKIKKKMFPNYKLIKGLRCVILFYVLYMKFFTKEVLLTSEYIHHEFYDNNVKYDTNDKRLAFAEELVNKYARASGVVTSRIHCALPCLSLETPVIYTENKKQTLDSSCRLGGIKDLFNILCFDGKYTKANFEINKKLSAYNMPKNKSLYKQYQQSLINLCKKFYEKIT